MSLGSRHLWLKVVLAGALAFGETSAFALNECSQELVDTCRSDASSTMSQVGSQSYTSGNSKQDVQRTGQANRWGGAQMGTDAGKCEDSAAKCKKCAKGDKEEEKKCGAAVVAQANTMKEQSQSMSSGGGEMGAIAGLLGAAAGIAAAMMNKKDKKPPQQNPVATGALQLNGALNCSMQDSYRYADCEQFLSKYCTETAAASSAGTVASTPTTGTVISMPGGGLPPTPDCASFNASYCSSSVTAPQPYGMMRTDGAVTQVNMAGTGGGIGTPYCSRTVASNWCTENPARSMCPSCRQADAYNSQTCSTNPALCPAVTAPQQVTMATDNAACAGDPLYTPGSPFALAGVGTTGSTTGGVALAAGVSAVGATGYPVSTGVPNVTVPTVGGGGGGLPVAILPTSIKTASAQMGGREGRAPGGGNAAGGGSSSFSGVTLKTSSAHAHANANELIAAGGVIIANGPGAPSRGPASDVEAKFGPSLFTTSSQVIRQHCQAGKLKNCP